MTIKDIEFKLKDGRTAICLLYTSQLLLMRMFFEVHKNSDVNVNSLNKYEIFQSYIDAVFERNKPECEAFLNKIVAHMYSCLLYTSRCV